MGVACACGCGREVLPPALAVGDPFFSRKCAERARGLSVAADRDNQMALRERRHHAGRLTPTNALQRERIEADRVRREALGLREP